MRRTRQEVMAELIEKREAYFEKQKKIRRIAASSCAVVLVAGSVLAAVLIVNGGNTGAASIDAKNETGVAIASGSARDGNEAVVNSGGQLAAPIEPPATSQIEYGGIPISGSQNGNADPEATETPATVEFFEGDIAHSELPRSAGLVLKLDSGDEFFTIKNRRKLERLVECISQLEKTDKSIYLYDADFLQADFVLNLRYGRTVYRCTRLKSGYYMINGHGVYILREDADKAIIDIVNAAYQGADRQSRRIECRIVEEISLPVENN